MFSLNNYLSNYWQAQTLIFVVIFLVAVFISIRRKTEGGSMPKETSNELRGLAILGVIFTHITYGLYWGTDFLFPFGIWGGVAVDLFFFLSGYGLAASAIYHPKKIAEFYKKRVVKIFAPLWIFLIVILLADFFILGRSYPTREIINAFIGFFPNAHLFNNINSPLWFITPLLLYYLIFPLVFRPKHPFLSLIPIFAVGYIAFLPGLPVSYQISQFYKVHAFAFPLGALFAALIVSPAALCAVCVRAKNCFLYNNLLCGFAILPADDKFKPLARAVIFLKNLPAVWRWIFMSILAFLACYTAYYSGVGKGVWLESSYAFFTMLCVLFLFELKKTKFALLELIGVYSFEIYLIHFPMMSRYDIFYRCLPPWLATLLYIPFLLLIAYLFNRLIEYAISLISGNSEKKKIPS